MQKEKLLKQTELFKKSHKFLFWIPRILSILFIVFLSLFSFDVISPELTIWQIVVGMLIHNIPSFVLLAILIISWRYEIVGGIVFIIAGLFYIATLFFSGSFEWYMLSWSFTIAGPAIFIGVLFLIGWFKKIKYV